MEPLTKEHYEDLITKITGAAAQMAGDRVNKYSEELWELITMKGTDGDVPTTEEASRP